jgi:DNA polymerase I-like protein with 3'-5' exonuclease and polymerase domains
MEHPSGRMLRQYLKVVKDQSQVGDDTKGGWLTHYNEKTHSIHHRVDLLGATTHRATHASPNLAQVPADHDFRELFTAPPGRVMVGADLKNIEIRVLAHYLAKYDKGKYADAVLSKDMHWLTYYRYADS